MTAMAPSIVYPLCAGAGRRANVLVCAAMAAVMAMVDPAEIPQTMTRLGRPSVSPVVRIQCTALKTSEIGWG